MAGGVLESRSAARPGFTPWATRCHPFGVRSDPVHLRRDLELHPLGERQPVAPVQGAGLAAHVGLPGVRAGLAAAAGLPLASEGASAPGPRRAAVPVRAAAAGL